MVDCDDCEVEGAMMIGLVVCVMEVGVVFFGTVFGTMIDGGYVWGSRLYRGWAGNRRMTKKGECCFSDGGIC